MKMTVIQKLENIKLSLQILSGRILLLARQPASLHASPGASGALSGRSLCSPSAEEDQGPQHAQRLRIDTAEDEI